MSNQNYSDNLNTREGETGTFKTIIMIIYTTFTSTRIRCRSKYVTIINPSTNSSYKSLFVYVNGTFNTSLYHATGEKSVLRQL